MVVCDFVEFEMIWSKEFITSFIRSVLLQQQKSLILFFNKNTLDSFVLSLSWKAVSDKPQSGRSYYESLHKNGSNTSCTLLLYATEGLNWIYVCKPKNLNNLQKKSLEPEYWLTWFQILDPCLWAYHKTRKPEILLFLCF